MENGKETLKKLARNGVFLKYKDIVRLCEKYHINELSIFGSSIRDDFNEDSDVDLLISYKPKAKISLFDESGLWYEFSTLINREVDLVDIRGLKNPIRREDILATREIVYVNN